MPTKYEDSVLSGVILNKICLINTNTISSTLPMVKNQMFLYSLLNSYQNTLCYLFYKGDHYLVENLYELV